MIRNPFKTDNGPATRAFYIEPSDTAELEHVTKKLFIGKGGCLHIVMADDSEPTRILGVQDGTTLDISVRKVLACSTAADRLVGFY